ncbi:NAD-dependent epimerase/dehydratase family protein [Candidatus Pacearchaeota archaeon]|nr:NAD-dependent epimerase/dehydratase family protein [Candidatus Pacearchaeota archaeon]
MNKKILITGGMGFIGSHLAKKYAESKDKVYILSRSYNKKRNISNIENKINLIIKDVRNIKKSDVADKDYIFHLAGTVDNYAIKEGEKHAKNIILKQELFLEALFLSTAMRINSLLMQILPAILKVYIRLQDLLQNIFAIFIIMFLIWM